MDFLDQKDDSKPFFLLMSYRAPHGHERRIGNTSMYADREEAWGKMQRLHAAKISLLDREIGRLLNRLDQDGDLENTLVLFTSDNGPHAEGKHLPNRFNSSGGFRGIKRDLYEGGVRVPMIAFWKDRIEPGSVSRHPSIFYDVMPTLADVAGIDKPDQTDGISFIPELTGGKQAKHDYLYFELLRVHKAQFRQGIRKGYLKAVHYGKNSKLQLFDLNKDPAETQDLASRYPGIALEMEKLMEQSHIDVPGCMTNSEAVR